MPRKYIRKTENKSYTEETLSKALEAIKKDGRKIREVGRSFGIPESTLRKYLLLNRPQAPRLGRKSVFSPETEEELKDYMLKLCNLFYGVTQKQLRRLAYRFAEANNIPNNFNKELGLAGKDWVYCFLKRHPIVRLRTPQGTSLNRIEGFNKEEVNLFYSNLKTVMEKHNFQAHRIYNQDETGVTTVQKKCTKIYGPKGAKQVGAATSAERGRTITAIFSMSASGHFLPPLFVYPRSRMTNLLEKNGPLGAVYHCSKNGWSNAEIFLQWLHHFRNHVHPAEDDPVLLILDNHGSHVSIESYEFCRQNFIHVVSLPPHTSHKLQPLDLTFFSPFKSAFYRECDFYLTSSGHTKITEYDVAELVNKAFVKVAKISTAVSGFKTPGIYPYDPDRFTEEDFAAARALRDQQVSVEICASPETPTPATSKSNLGLPQTATKETPGPSVTADEINTPASTPDVYENPIPSTSKDNSFLTFAPVPKKVKNVRNNRPGVKQHSEILTSTPMKIKLEIAKEKRKINEEKKKLREMKKASRQLDFQSNIRIPQKKKPTKPKRKIKLEKYSSDENDLDPKSLCQDDEFDDLDTDILPISVHKNTSDLCNTCGEIGKDRELWYRCVNCACWSHADCSGADSAHNYICDYCKA